MNPRDVIDPELLDALERFPLLDFTPDKLAATRAKMAAARANWSSAPSPDDPIQRQELAIGAPGREAKLRLLTYRPIGHGNGPLSVIISIHGGAFVMGESEMDEPENRRFASELGAFVISVDYRLAPEHPFPAGLEDCYAALAYVHQNADALNIDGTRIAIVGKSAGGGIAAGLCLLARDRGEYAIAHQHLVYPMIDDRAENEAPAPAGEFVFRRGDARACWQAYLGEGARGDISPYAAPARAKDLSGLPPTFISVGDLDLFAAANEAYAGRLREAGAPTEFHLYPGAYHGFDMAAGAGVARRHQQHRIEALRRALA